MSNNSSFFDRLLSYAQSQGIKNTSSLSEALGYEKPEKLYRLKRNSDARPSFEVLEGISNLFEVLNLRWLITGKGEQEVPNQFSESNYSTPGNFQEPESVYITKSPEQKKLLKEKERIIGQQKETISALNEAYSQLKMRFEDSHKND